MPMNKKKPSTEPKAEASIILTPVPLDADAYYVPGNLTDLQRTHLKLTWEQMNRNLPNPKMLINLMEGVDLKPIPSSVLRKWVDSCNDILRERSNR